LEDFIAAERRLCVARAYKGEGKSALLRLSANKVRAIPERQIVIAVSATNLAPSLDSSDFASWVKAWKAAILDHVASEVGNTIGDAWSDDAMALVEQAERNGFKAKNIVSALIDSRVDIPPGYF
jgi:hypothetical protein